MFSIVTGNGNETGVLKKTLEQSDKVFVFVNFKVGNSTSE